MNAIGNLISSLISFLIFVAVVAVVVGVILYNKLQQYGQKVKAGHSNVLTMIQKRADLANKLMDIAREYGAHEKLTHITVSNNLVDTLQKSSDAITNISALATQYPDLKANGTYQQLMSQLHEIETELQNKREEYNTRAQEYNSYRLRIPQVLFASVLGFKEALYYDFENIQAIKEFKTDDGELLKNALSSATSRAVNLAKQGVESVKSTAKVCVSCGAKVTPTAKFCDSCGKATG